MAEIDKRALPDPQQPVSEDVKTPVIEDKASEGEKADVSSKEPVQTIESSNKEPPEGYVPYQSLTEERRKRKEAEQKLKELEEASAALTEDNGGVVNVAPMEVNEEITKKVQSLEKEVKTLKEERAMESLFATYPILRDKIQELLDFQESEYPNTTLDKVAKIFLAEKGLLETKEPRKGLEKTTGGLKTPSPIGPTEEELKDLRENHPRKYEKLIKEGKIGT